MRIALVSLNQAWQDPVENLRRAEASLQSVVEQGCAWAVFPEMTLMGFSSEAVAVQESHEGSLSLQGFGQLAKKWNINLVFGACLKASGSRRPQNVACHADPTGRAVAVYAKAHPFSHGGEDKSFEAGNHLGYLDVGPLRIGLSICYDLRFPILYAAMAARCDGVICLANWPRKRIHHWKTLLAARALENQIYLLGVNRTGVDGLGVEYEKSSCVADPDGSWNLPVWSSPLVDVHDIIPERIRMVRESFPVLPDRRHAWYQTLLGEECQ